MFPPRDLLILPGSGDPGHPVYIDAYELIEDEARRHGYVEVHSDIRWRGQASGGDPEGELTFDGAVEQALRFIDEALESGRPLDVLGRSFGSAVAAHIAAQDGATQLERVILWGTPGFVTFWQHWHLNGVRAREKALGRGTRTDPRLFSGIVPFEHSIHEAKCPITLCVGGRDEYVEADYIRSVASGAKGVEIREVADAPHVVDSETPAEVRALYASALFAPQGGHWQSPIDR